MLRTQHEGITEASEVDHGVKYLLRRELDDPNSNPQNPRQPGAW